MIMIFHIPMLWFLCKFNLYSATCCLMWPYFCPAPLKSHKRQVWLYNICSHFSCLNRNLNYVLINHIRSEYLAWSTGIGTLKHGNGEYLSKHIYEFYFLQLMADGAAGRHGTRVQRHVVVALNPGAGAVITRLRHMAVGAALVVPLPQQAAIHRAAQVMQFPLIFYVPVIYLVFLQIFSDFCGILKGHICMVFKSFIKIIAECDYLNL